MVDPLGMLVTNVWRAVVESVVALQSVGGTL